MSNSFGRLFRMTSFGESHGVAVGVVIDGCPSGIEIDRGEFKQALEKRAPGRSPYTSPRKEPDDPHILSGIYEGRTTGAPIAVVVYNKDADSRPYQEMQDVYRPGHANFTYEKKYGHFDYRGSGRSSARETIARVLASVVAKKILAPLNLQFVTSLKQLGSVKAKSSVQRASPEYLTHDKVAEKKMITVLEQAMEEKDSLGGVVESLVFGVPVGLGEPIYGKLTARMAEAMLSIPAVKGFEMGEGFSVASMKGSENNDIFALDAGQISLKTNHSGGTLGGISTGSPLVMQVAFKPTSTIGKLQKSVNKSGQSVTFSAAKNGRHDPCVAIRAVPIVEAMSAIVLADLYLLNQTGFSQ